MLTFSALVSAQDSAKKVYTDVEQMPEFQGGSEALAKFMIDHVRYPDEAKKEKITGKVFISFVIDEKGNVTEARVERAVHPLLDQEALRAVNEMPVWKPGRDKGKAVKVSIVLPVQFALN